MPEGDTDKLSYLESIPFVPKDWTVLYHGTNLGKPEWNNRQDQLNKDQIVIEGMCSGLSCIDDREKREIEARTDGATNISYTTATDSYSWGNGTSIEIRVITPHLDNRSRIGVIAKQSLSGELTKDQLLAGEQFFNNHLARHYGHPIIPKGTVLTKIGELEPQSDGRRVLYYVPEMFTDVYISQSGKKQTGS